MIRHEALVNPALAGLPVNVLCPYDIQLGTGLIASVERTHPELTQGGAALAQLLLHSRHSSRASATSR